ncbi:hypothetical protein [Dehalobacterium formicoaceticum]|uniref:Uncharacterized protein n=1 Tax=Dehalobacterium formicoaceticum TaxID=51515 RepID=A0ABT1Y8R3_9FIRM|nr:hypothetical protein [Dehalobacterium formicoaceticum]MCR6546475.1 hypothetical protein [Dehalobacterium formicoaceticum]
MTSIYSLLSKKFQFKAHALKKEWKEIEKIKKELRSLGFITGEVEYMVKCTFHHKNFSEINLEELKAGKESLKGQVEISRQCLELVYPATTNPQNDPDGKN